MKKLFPIVVTVTAIIIFLGIFSNNSFCKELTVIYTANSSGKLRACGCPHDPYGGLTERVTLMNNLREKEKSFLLVDGGNMVSLWGDFLLKADCVIQLMNLMKYDVALAGRSEVFHGTASALTIAQYADFPLISASIAAKSDSTPVFPSCITKRVKNVTVGVIGICDSTCYVLSGSSEFDYVILPIGEILGKTLSTLSGSCDFIVVLSQVIPETNKTILKDYPEIDLIVEGYGNTRYDSPIETPDGVIVSPGGKGDHVGLITLEKSHGNISVKRSDFFPVLNIPADKEASNIVQDCLKK